MLSKQAKFRAPDGGVFSQQLSTTVTREGIALIDRSALPPPPPSKDGCDRILNALPLCP